MAEITDIIVFDKNMMQDISGFRATKGSWKYAKNLGFRSNTEMDDYVVRAVRGQILMDNAALTGVGWEVLGFEYDNKTGYLYYLTRKSSTNTHQVWRWNSQNGHELVVSHPALNFMTSEQIKGIAIINGNIYWSEGIFESWELGVSGAPSYSPPHHFIIEKAILFTESGGTDPDGYLEFNYLIIDAIKCPPKFAPAVGYFSDATYQFNFLNRKLLQFAYRYIYDDGSRSMFSPFSALALPTSSELMDGKRYGDITTDNSILITLNTGNGLSNYIEVMVREGNNGNWGIFRKLVRVLDYGQNSNESFSIEYRGNEAITFVSADDLLNHDFLPDVAGHQRYLENNTIVYADNQEGYDPNPVNIGVAALYNRISASLGATAFGPVEPDNVEDGGIWFLVFVYGVFDFELVAVGDIILIRTRLLSNPADVDSASTIQDFYYTVQDGDQSGTTDFDQALSLFTAMHTYFSAQFPEYTWVLDSDFGLGLITLSISGHKSFTTVGENTNWPVIAQATKYPSHKQGTVFEYAIGYKQRANKSRGVENGIAHFYVPPQSAIPPSFDPDYYYYVQAFLQMGIPAELPPMSATHWYVARRERSGVGAFMQRSIASASFTAGRTLLTFEVWYQQTFTGADYYYTIEEGDSVVLKYAVDSGTTISPPLHLELTVMRVVSENEIEVEQFDPNQYMVGAGAVFQVGKVKKTSENYPFWEIAKEFPITDAHTTERKHGGEINTISITEVQTNESTILFVFVSGNHTYLSQREVTIVGIDSGDGTYPVFSIVYDPDTYRTRIWIATATGPNSQFPVGATVSFNLSQTTTQGALVVIQKGDTYVKRRTMGIGFDQSKNYMIEADNYSDYYDSNDYDKCRLQIYFPEGTQLRRDVSIRSSLKYLQNSNPELAYNQLNRFLPGNEQEVKVQYGKITLLEERGFVLRVGQLRKMNSVLIERATATNPDGTTEYVLTTTLLGAVDPSENEWGPYREEACMKIGSVIYYWDVINGQIVKDTTGGQFVINQEMNTHWKAVSRLILEADDPLVYKIRMGYNNFTHELYITMLDTTDGGASFTCSLDIRNDQWLSFFTFYPEMYATGDMRIFMFAQNTGKMWEHNVGEALSFFGVLQDWELHFWVNSQPVMEKVFETIGFSITDDVEEIIVSAPPDATNPLGQETKAFLTREENQYIGQVLRNYLGTSYPNQNVAMFEGDPMRNQFFLVRITGQTGVSVSLKHVYLGFNLS